MSNLCKIDENQCISLTWDSMSNQGRVRSTSPDAIPPLLPQSEKVKNAVGNWLPVLILTTAAQTPQPPCFCTLKSLGLGANTLGKGQAYNMSYF